MKGRSRRAKGHGFERELAKLLRAVYPGAHRGLGQARIAALQNAPKVADVEGTPFWVEAKRGNSASPRGAWKQATRQSDGRPPMVVFRDDQTAPGVPAPPAIVMMRLDDFLSEMLRERSSALPPAAVGVSAFDDDDDADD